MTQEIQGALRPYKALPIADLPRIHRLWPDSNGGGIDLSGDHSRVLGVTVQTREWYEELAAEGTVKASFDMVPDFFTEAYQWMSEKMGDRLPSGDAPTWWWVSVSPVVLRHELAKFADRTSVMVVAALPVEDVLLSVHEGWHAVLNRTWCSTGSEGAAEDAEYDRFLEAAEIETGTSLWTWEDLPEALRTRVEVSWMKCLIPHLWGSDAVVQGVTPSVSASDVLSAVRLG